MSVSTVKLVTDSNYSGSSENDPLLVIEPRQGWSPVKFGELWAYRELLYFLIWRDLKVRYKQTLIGITWVVIQPLLMTVIFTVFLGLLARVPSPQVPYPLLVYSGLLIWTFFNSGVSGCSSSLVANANLITKIYFPRLLVPASSVGGRLVDLGISLAILVVLILYYWLFVNYHFVFTWRLILTLPLMFLTMLLTFGLGMLFAALNVTYRDVGVALPVLLQLWMFVSPVVYPITVVPAEWRIFYDLNPVVGLIEGFRSSVFGGPFDLFALSVSMVATVAVLILSAYVFRRAEIGFADLI